MHHPSSIGHMQHAGTLIPSVPPNSLLRLIQLLLATPSSPILELLLANS